LKSCPPTGGGAGESFLTFSFFLALR